MGARSWTGLRSVGTYQPYIRLIFGLGVQYIQAAGRPLFFVLPSSLLGSRRLSEVLCVCVRACVRACVCGVGFGWVGRGHREKKLDWSEYVRKYIPLSRLISSVPCLPFLTHVCPSLPTSYFPAAFCSVSGLARVIGAQAECEETRLEKERSAVLSELTMVNTIDYRMECQVLSALHAENQLSRYARRHRTESMY